MSATPGAPASLSDPFEALVASLTDPSHRAARPFRVPLDVDAGLVPSALDFGRRWKAPNGVILRPGADGALAVRSRAFATRSNRVSRAVLRVTTDTGGLWLAGTIREAPDRLVRTMLWLAAVPTLLSCVLMVATAVDDGSALGLAAALAASVVLALLFVSLLRRPAPRTQAAWLAADVLRIRDAVTARLVEVGGPVSGAGSLGPVAPAPPVLPQDPADRETVRRAVALLRDCPEPHRGRIEAAYAPLSVAEVADILQGAAVDAPGRVDPNLLATARDVLGEGG